MIERQFRFPVDVLAKVVELIPSCPRPTASEMLRHFLNLQRDDTVPLISSIANSLFAALQSNDAFVNNCLAVLADIVQNTGDLLVTDEFTNALTALIATYSRDLDYGESLLACIAATFASDSPASHSLVLALFDAVEASDAWLPVLDSFASAVLLFVLLHPHAFASLAFAGRVLNFAVGLLQAGVSPSQENALCDLLAAVLQLRPPSAADFAPAIAALPFQQPHNSWQVLASLFLAGHAPLDAPALCAFLHTPRPCLYEKRLFAAALAAAAPAVAAALLAAEQQQRAALGGVAREFPCSHNLPFPIEAD
jgi:hypothetical protein